MTTEGSSRSPELREVLNAAVEYHLRDLHVALPGRIEKYDNGEQKADVKPLVKRLVATEDGEEIVEELPVISAVPVVFQRGGGFYLSMPVKKGDFCLLVFNSFPIDNYKAGTGNDASPEDFSTHELTDAVAVMGFAPFSKSIADADADNIVLGEENGVQFHVASDKIELGQKGSGDQVPLESKVQQQLAAISQQINSIGADITLLATHTHVGNLGAPTGPPIPPPTGGQSYNESATASALVTIKE